MRSLSKVLSVLSASSTLATMLVASAPAYATSYVQPTNGVPSQYTWANMQCWTQDGPKVLLSSTCTGYFFWNVPLTLSKPLNTAVSVQPTWYGIQPSPTTSCVTVFTYTLGGAYYASSSELCGAGEIHPFSAVTVPADGTALLSMRVNRGSGAGQPGIASIRF